MFMKRTAICLLAFGALVMGSSGSFAQVPANSNLDYETPQPRYENGSAPFAESDPRSHGSWLPFKPVGVQPSWDWFAPADTSSYGNGPRSKIGWFFSFERVLWSLGAPKPALIGDPNAQFSQPFTIPATCGVDTGFLTANPAWGNRWEIGFVDNDNYGWLVSVLDHVSQGQHRVFENPLIQFGDPNNLLSGFVPTVDPVTGALIDADLNNNNVFGRFGLDLGRPNPAPPPPFFVPPPDGHPDTPAPTDNGDRVQFPIIFNLLDVKNITRLNGIELMRMYRAPRMHNGGFFDVLYGVRYLQIDDTFKVFGTNTVNTVITDIFSGITTSTTTIDTTNPLADSAFSIRAQNNVVGPQIGFRYANTRGRWTNSMEARFEAGANFQNVHLKSSVGSQLIGNPTFTQAVQNVFVGSNISLFHGFGTDQHAHAVTFSPVGELRFQTVCSVTKSVGLKFGYTGLVVGNVTRASNRIDYSGPCLISITGGGIHQLFFSNGVNFGVEINR